MIRFREKSPVLIGLVGAVVVLVLLGLALNADKLVRLGGTGYSALVPEAAGLKAGDDVALAGVPIGTVRDVVLDGPDVRVDFTVTDADAALGDRTRAAISVATVLGEKQLRLTSEGTGVLDPSVPIPRERTSAPFDVPEAVSTLTRTTGEIDVDQLSTALDTISTTLDDSAPQLRPALDGVTALSQTISSRDEALRELLGKAENVSGVLAQRADQLRLLVNDGNQLLAELQSRQRDIEELLAGIGAMSRQLTGLVEDNRAEVGPLLDRLNSVSDVLKRDQDQIAAIIKGVGGYATSLGEAVGSGPFFQAYVQNLVPGNLVPLSDFLPQVEGSGGR